MVKEIKPSGRLKMTLLGGFMWHGVEWEGVTIRTHDDRRYRGTVLPSNPSTHVNRKLGGIERTAEMMEVRLDARTTAQPKRAPWASKLAISSSSTRASK